MLVGTFLDAGLDAGFEVGLAAAAFLVVVAILAFTAVFLVAAAAAALTLVALEVVAGCDKTDVSSV